MEHPLLDHLKQAVRGLLGVSLGTVVSNTPQSDAVVDAVEAVLMCGRFRGVSPWDWLQSLERENVGEGFTWAVESIRCIRGLEGVHCSRGRVRSWIRLALNDGILSSALALLVENVEVTKAFYSSSAILTKPDASRALLQIIVPVGGKDIDARRLGHEGEDASLVRFELQLLPDADRELLNSDGDDSDESDKPLQVHCHRVRASSKGSRSRQSSVGAAPPKADPDPRPTTPPAPPSQPIASTPTSDPAPAPAPPPPNGNGTSSRHTEETATPTTDPAPSPSAPGSFCSTPTVSPSDEMAKVRRDLQAWREQRAKKKQEESLKGSINSSSASESPRTRAPSLRRQVGRLDPPMGDAVERTLAAHHTPWLTPEAHRDPIMRHLVSCVQYCGLLEERLAATEAELARERENKADLSQPCPIPRTSDPGHASPLGGGRFLMRHHKSRLWVSLMKDRVVLTKTLPPVAFRFVGEHLIHDDSNQFVNSATVQGVSDPVLTIVGTPGDSRWLYSRGGLLWDASFGGPVHPYKGKEVPDDCTLLVLHRSTVNPERLRLDLEPLGGNAAVCGGMDVIETVVADRWREDVRLEEQVWKGRVRHDMRPDPAILLSPMPAEAFSASSRNNSPPTVSTRNSSPAIADPSPSDKDTPSPPPPPSQPSTANPPPETPTHSERASPSLPNHSFESSSSFAWNTQQDTSKHRMKLITTVKEKHKTYKEKEHRIDLQGRQCKACLTPLTKTWSVVHVAWRYDTVRFCWYMGYYYCQGCQDDTLALPIPSRMLHEWDFRPRPVCRDAYQYLRSIWERPVVCISAISPSLFEQVEALKAARQIRVQLSILNGIVQGCPQFAEWVKSHPESINEGNVYYSQESELYSMADLESFHTSQPLLRGVANLSNQRVLETMKAMRAKMITHVVQDCPDRCYAGSAMTCGHCSNPTPIFAFEIKHIQQCPRCQRVYHRVCYRLQPCKHCFS